MALSIIWYYFPVYGGVHWFKGPIATVEGFGLKPTDSGSLGEEAVITEEDTNDQEKKE